MNLDKILSLMSVHTRSLATASIPYLRENMKAGVLRAIKLKPKADSSEFIERPEVVDAMRNMSLKFAESIDHTLAVRLTETLADGLQAGEETLQLRKRVQAVFKVSKQRAEQIARTESARAYTRGFRMQGSTVEVITGYVWMANADACEFCLDVDGKIVKGDENFFEVGDTVTLESGKSLNLDYDIVFGPPLHVNCRCDMDAVLDTAIVGGEEIE